MGSVAPVAGQGRAVAELETSILQHFCRINKYLDHNSAATHGDLVIRELPYSI